MSKLSIDSLQNPDYGVKLLVDVINLEVQVFCSKIKVTVFLQFLLKEIDFKLVTSCLLPG